MPTALSLDDIDRLAKAFMNDSGLTLIPAATALRPDLAGLRMYDPPLIGIASSDDPLFTRLLRPEVIGPQFRLPREWLPEAASVISLFLPHSATVSESNRADPEWPSAEWLHARIEGQTMIDRLIRYLADKLQEAGWLAVVPTLLPEYKVWRNPVGAAESEPRNPTSNWSERHVAHVAGLGTFGLSRAFITLSGASGRLASLVTSLPLPPTPRPYERYDEYCIHCGACARRCPAKAILSEQTRKIKHLCADRIDAAKIKFAPRYGCGKCHVGVPCEHAAPGRRT